METSTTEKLAAALAALRRCEERSLAGHFALEVMHEIRNPLDALGNLVHLAAQTDDVSAIHAFMRDAQEQIKTLHEIAGQSLKMARAVQAGTSVPLVDLVEAALRVHHRRMTSKSIHLVRDMQQSETIRVHTGEIVQVLSNLVGNALDATPVGGTISLRIRVRGNDLCLLVSDNGHGISPGNLSRLFQPFFTTKNDEGNGLGLTLSAKILERHHGSIRVRSSVKPSRSGTTFRICLPLKAA